MKKNNKNILNIINISEEGRFGGPAKRIINVAKELKNMNVQTKIIIPYLDSNYFESYAKKNNIDYKKINITRLTLEKKYLILYIFRFFYELFLLNKLLKKENPDIIHINGSYQFKSFLAACLCNTKIVWHLNNQKENIVVKMIFRFLIKFKSPSFIVASEKARKYFIPNISKECIVTEIHAPVVIDSFNQKENYNLKKKIIIGTTTNFSPQKDLITFVKVAYEIKKINKNVEFCIGGAIRNSQNNYTQQVMKEIKKLDLKNNIKLLGFVSDVPLYLSKLDIFINTSAWEGSPTAVWEALAYGLPVVTTDVGSIDYYVGKLKAGLVSRVGDHKGLSQNIIKFINSYELRKEFGLRAIFIAKKFLNVERCAKLHNIHYKKMLEK